MNWVAMAVGGWLVVSLAVALLVGLSIRLADRRAREADEADVADVAPEPAVPPRIGTRPAGTRTPAVRECITAAERHPRPRAANRR